MNLYAIRKDIERDLHQHKVCESCENAPSEYLYIVKNLIFGIFHICEECRLQLVFTDMPDIKSKILKKFQAICWEDYVEVEVDTPLR